MYREHFIILFAVDLSFPIFVSNMSVAVIFFIFVVHMSWAFLFCLVLHVSRTRLQGFRASNELARAENIPNALENDGYTGPQISFEPGPFVIRTPVILKWRLSTITSQA